MVDVNRSTLYSPTGPLGLDPVVAGTACCVVSAFGYTASNVCMRYLSKLGADPMWVTCNKELVTVVVVGPWLVWRAFRRLPVLPPWRTIGLLALVGLAVQLAGNLSVQWAFGKIGLAVAVSAVMGVMLCASAVMGRIMLGERISSRSAAAIGILLGSLALLAVGAPAAAKSILDATGTVPGLLVVALGVAAACLAGAMYALLTIVIRHTATRAVPVTTIVFIVTAMGVLSLGPLSAWRLGPQQLLNTPPAQIAWMLAAGTCNLIAFLAIAKGLELTTVVHANVLNASQVAMGAVAGMAFFGESRNPWLIFGVGLAIVGIILIDRPTDADRDVDQHA